MKDWIKYLIILVIVGFILGYLAGPIFYAPPVCPGMECMGDPNTMRIPVGITGAIIGVVIGWIVGKIRSKKK